MTFETIQALIESGGTLAFALLVWWELRSFRNLVDQKIDNALSLLNRIDERTKRE